MGNLPGQGGKLIRFAHAPKLLQVTGPKGLGLCQGYVPLGVENCPRRAYASSDIFFLEVRLLCARGRNEGTRIASTCFPMLAFILQVCLYSVICKNINTLWQVEAGQDWHCALDYDGFQRARDAILRT